MIIIIIILVDRQVFDKYFEKLLQLEIRPFKKMQFLQF